VPDILPHRPAAPDEAPPDPERPAPTAAAGEPPLLVGADRAASMCGISPASWYRLKAAGKTPAPVKLGGRVLYRSADLQLWVALGCPPRKEFEIRKAAQARGRPSGAGRGL
jgi:predicted DNA-binding transcriptional regulator AlpA